VLEGFEKIFDALDEIIRLIRKSDGKADAADKIIKRFELDAEQTDAILELKLYRLARLEILVIQNELADKRKRARQISAMLKDEDARKTLVREEIQEVQKKYGDKRRSSIEAVEEVAFTEDDFIIEEDNVVIVSRDGWVKRQKEVRDLSSTRLREGDSVLAAIQGSTRATAVFFSNFGAAYTARIIDVPASTGYGEPIQKLFKLKDGERIVAAMSLDARVAGAISHPARAKASALAEPPPVHAVAVTSDGYALRFGLEGFVEASTRAGRRFARPSEGVEVVGVEKVTGKEVVIAATREAHAMLTRVDEINYLSGPGKGVILVKLSSGEDAVLGFRTAIGDRDILRVETSRGAEVTISLGKYDPTGRGGKGRELLQRGQFTRVIPPEVENPQPLSD
jgi:DNA gyrase subunit A